MDRSSSILTRYSFASISRHKSKAHTYIEAHRGCHTNEPENTLKAFQSAIESSIDSIELDVWLTKDNIPVVIHGKEDGDISESTDGKGRVNDLTLSDLKKLKTLREGTVPSLEEVFVLCRNKIFINLELKDTQCEPCFKEVITLIHNYEMNSQVALSSFNHTYWEEVRRHNVTDVIEFGFLFDSNYKGIPFEHKAPKATINLRQNEITPEFVQAAHQNDMAVHCWFGMKDEENEEIILHLLRCGVDIICCNNPTQALIFRERFISSCGS